MAWSINANVNVIHLIREIKLQSRILYISVKILDKEYENSINFSLTSYSNECIFIVLDFTDGHFYSCCSRLSAGDCVCQACELNCVHTQQTCIISYFHDMGYDNLEIPLEWSLSVESCSRKIHSHRANAFTDFSINTMCTVKLSPKVKQRRCPSIEWYFRVFFFILQSILL